MEEENNLHIEKAKADNMIRQRIFIIRGHKVMMDSDLAELYGISTGRFNEQVKRNTDRFPNDFMFQLVQDEYENLISQFAISSLTYGGRRHLPYVFTEHGVAMLSSILNSKKAILMNIFIVRAFIKMRESLDNYKDLLLKIGKMELKQKKDSDILYEVYGVVQQITEAPIKPLGKIGFNKEE